ncbi:MAG: ribonuclease J [Alphaproteobacteria bacterium]|nr:ribonuclease J [Alphaproteobacteria bacterium]
MSHSIPEARLLAIETPQGLIVHSGDWNGDHNPILNKTNFDKLDALAEQGVLALVADSTNVMTTTSEADMPTESAVADNLKTVIAACRGRVVVTCFASNVARLQSVARAGLNSGRQVALVGRSMWRMNAVAREVGYLDGLPKFKTAGALVNTPDRECLCIVTGSQGEPRAALTRMAQSAHPELRLKPKDTVIYSSREIPGNGKSISAVHNELALMGVAVINADQAGIHASGHANRQQASDFLKRLKPKILIPVHGEGRHLVSHIALAKECQVPQCLLVQNGECVQFSSAGDAEIADAFDAGKLAMDGNRYIRSDSRIIVERRKIAFDGVLSIALAVDELGDLVSEPELSALGLLEEEDEIGYDQLYDALEKACRVFQGHGPLNKHCESVEKAMRQQAHKLLGKRPWVQVLIVEV